MKRTKIVDHELVTMTPKDAERLLARNYEGNRRIKSRAVANLAAVMEAGEFNSENGQTIASYTTGSTGFPRRSRQTSR